MLVKNNFKFFGIYFCFTVVMTLIIGLSVYPSRRSWWDLNGMYFSRAEKNQSWVFKKADLNFDKLDLQTFRVNEKRQGVYYDVFTFSKNNKLKLLSNDDINIGKHSASKSSPLVTKDYIITSSDFGLLLILDRQTQKILWTLKSYSAQVGFHATPALINNHIIVGDYDGRLYSIDLENRTLNWLIDLGDAIGASPAIDSEGFVYVNVELKSPNGFLAKVDSRDGRLVWTSEFLGDQGHSSPTISKKYRLVLIGDNTGHFSAFDIQTGNVAWKLKANGPIKSTGTIYNDEIVFSSWDGFIYSVEIKTGEVTWKTKLEDYNQSSMAIIEELGIGYINSNKGLCQIDLKEAIIKRCSDISNQGSSSRLSSPIVILSENDQTRLSSYLIWTPCAQKAVCVYRASDLKLLKQWELKSSVSGEIVLSYGELFFITDQEGGLYRLDMLK